MKYLMTVISLIVFYSAASVAEPIKSWATPILEVPISTPVVTGALRWSLLNATDMGESVTMGNRDYQVERKARPGHRIVALRLKIENLGEKPQTFDMPLLRVVGSDGREYGWVKNWGDSPTLNPGRGWRWRVAFEAPLNDDALKLKVTDGKNVATIPFDPKSGDFMHVVFDYRHTQNPKRIDREP